MKIIIGSKFEENHRLATLAEKSGNKDETKRLRKERLAALDVYDGPIFGRDASTMSDEILVHELEWANRKNDADNADLVVEARKRSWEVSK